MVNWRTRSTFPLGPLTLAWTFDPLRPVTAPCSVPKVTLLVVIDTPPLTAGPLRRTTRGALVPWTCMVCWTVTSPALFGLDCWTVPVTVAVKGTVRRALVDPGCVGLGTVGEAEVPLETPAADWAANLAAIWASSADDVPARFDQPGRSGPARAKTPIPITTTVVAPAVARRPTFGMPRAATIRHATAPTTEAIQTTSINSMIGKRVSVPLPSPCRTAMGQQA